MSSSGTYLPDEHLENKDSKAPPVNGPRVRRISEHLRSQKLGGPTKSPRTIPEAHSLLAEPKVGDLHVALRVEQQIIQLQIPINDAVVVQILQAQNHAGRVKNSPRFGENVRVDVHHQVSSGSVLHDEADVGLCLEAGEEVHQEGVSDRVGGLEDALFGEQGLHFVAGDDVAFLQRFYGEVLAGVLVLGEDDLAEVAAAQDADQPEVVHAHARVLGVSSGLVGAVPVTGFSGHWTPMHVQRLETRKINIKHWRLCIIIIL